MAVLRSAAILIVFMALFLGTTSHDHRGPHNKFHDHRHRPNNDHDDSAEKPKPCSDDPLMQSDLPPCSGPTTSANSQDSAVQANTEDNSEETNNANSPSTTATPSTLERAHWCRLPNDTYLPFNFTFIHTTCTVCRCTEVRTIRCQPLQCMPTYCLDNTMPHRQTGECCTRCRYDDTKTNTSCLYNNLYYPHGSILKNVEGTMQCWCQLGNIECRTPMSSMSMTLDIIAGGATIYLFALVFFIVLIIGSLFCCGISILFYYYYQHNQQQFQDAYDQYINSAGWQPMEDEEGHILDDNAQEKYVEAEKSQYEDGVTEAGPPAYDGHFSEHNKKQ